MQVINFRSPIHNTTSQSTRATADHDYDIPLFILTTIAICQGKGDGICVLKNKTSPVKISPVSMILQIISKRLALHLFLLSILFGFVIQYGIEKHQNRYYKIARTLNPSIQTFNQSTSQTCCSKV